MKIRLPYALNEIGQRGNQEDSIFPRLGEATDASRLFLVCDGMGGHENGEVASGLVCSTFAERLATIDNEQFNNAMFLEALEAAYDALDRKDPNPESGKKMGTTLTFLHLNDSEAVVAHMGDSRVYHIRPSAAEPILYKSSDHSLVNELVRAEIITPEEALTHPRRNVITRAMQPNLEQRYKADIRNFNDVAAGDYFFLCSDGVLESVSDELLVDILSSGGSDADKIAAIKSTCEASSRDNFSAYLVPIAEGIARKANDAGFVEVMDTQFAEDEGHTQTSPLPIKPQRDAKRSNLKGHLLIGSVALLGVCVGIAVVMLFMNDKEDKRATHMVAPVENVEAEAAADAKPEDALLEESLDEMDQGVVMDHKGQVSKETSAATTAPAADEQGADRAEAEAEADASELDDAEDEAEAEAEAEAGAEADPDPESAEEGAVRGIADTAERTTIVKQTPGNGPTEKSEGK